MTLDRGTTFGPFVITDALGAGGMGEVYRATDTNLNREVAIKILPQVFVDDADRVARFQREAEILASLNHPNIAHVHGLERSNGSAALVMELVEGQTLDEHLAQGPIPQEQALRIAKQISEALESAHARDVIHRDLKPANVKLSVDGRVKVLDFGLAKVVARSATAPPPTPPGKAGVSTEPGAIFGTPAYMSPEQVRGGIVDKRSDVWAFGCVLFELLTGEPAFSGPTKSDVCASVLNAEPNWNLLPARTPASVRRLLRRCLSKDVERRMRDIGDARLDLEEAGDDQPAAAPPRRSRTGLAVAAAGVAIVAVAVTLGVFGRFGSKTPEQDEFRFELSTPATAVPEQFALSPDGSRVVSVGTSADGSSKLWVKEIGSSLERELAGTDGAEWPFWSVDGRSVSFYAQGALRKYDLTTQGVQVLVDRFGAQPFLGGTWNGEGVLLAAYAFTAPIRMFSYGPEGAIDRGDVTRLDRTRETGHAFPHFLPDGEHFLYYVNGNAEISGTYVGSLDGSVKKRLMPSDSTAVYSEPGRLLFLRGKTLYAQPFDLRSLALRGEAFVVADGPVVSSLGSGGMSASREGTIVYRTGMSGGSRRFVWRDEQGRELDSVADVLVGAPSSPELTAQENGIVFQRALTGVNLDVWLLEFGGEAPSRITLEDGNEWLPIVSPIDDTLVYANYALNAPNRAPTQLLTKRLSTNAVRGEPLLETESHKRPMAYSADGRTILYATLWEPSYQRLGIAPRGGWDIWALSVDSRETFPVAYTEANEWNAQFSPDQSWVAFESDESGIVEVYLQSYPDGKVKKKVSSRGGAQPRWFGDGGDQYLYFADLGGVLYRTRLIPGAESALVSLGPAERLFQANIGKPAPRTYVSKPQYLVDRSGRILTNDVLQSYEPLRVARHWSGAPTPR